MKRLLALPVLTILALSSCSTVQSARDALDTMPDENYVRLVGKVENAGVKGGVMLADRLGDDTILAVALTNSIIDVIESDKVVVSDVVKGVIDQYGDKLNLSEEQLGYIRDGAKLIDAAVGQIRLGIDGKLTEREKGLILALLRGLKTGMQSQIEPSSLAKFH